MKYSIVSKFPTDIIHIPHDSMLFGMNAYEIKKLSSALLEEVVKTAGHYTVKVKPTLSKKSLHDYGFYYCDTLIEPYCAKEKFIYHENEIIDCKFAVNIHELLSICQNAFIYGRFHRDFNISKQQAENRYVHWLKQIHKTGNVYSLYYKSDCAGFIAVEKNKLVLHALSQKYKGKSLAKFFWSKACLNLFNLGHTELFSSISAANLPAVNLYRSLGFNFRNAIDVYHRFV